MRTKLSASHRGFRPRRYEPSDVGGLVSEIHGVEEWAGDKVEGEAEVKVRILTSNFW